VPIDLHIRVKTGCAMRGPAKADKRTRSKWSRMMRYAAAYKADSEELHQFVRRKGGISACAARFSRWLGRGDRSAG
jgi:hypothetical protein